MLLVTNTQTEMRHISHEKATLKTVHRTLPAFYTKVAAGDNANESHQLTTRMTEMSEQTRQIRAAR